MLPAFRFGKPFSTFFDGDNPETKPEGEVEDDPKLLEGGDPKKSFTQEEVNAILAKDRKKYEEKTKKTVAELENLKKSKSLTENEKSTLQAKIDELNQSLLTKEELAKKEQDKLVSKHKKELETTISERETWKERFTTNEILRSISDEAHANQAFNPSQIIAILKPLTALREVTDEAGAPIGVFEPRVKYPDKDKDGKKVTLDLSVSEAVKRMKETTDVYGNLFRETAAGGLGMGQGQKPSGPVDFKNIKSFDDYKKSRVQLGLDPLASDRK